MSLPIHAKAAEYALPVVGGGWRTRQPTSWIAFCLRPRSAFPIALRYRLAYDSRLVRDVLGIFVRAVYASLRRRACAYAGIRKAQCGAGTFVQRFGGAVNLNGHFHSLVLDGVYYLDDRQRLRFRRLPPPSDAEVGRVTSSIARRVVRLLDRRGLGREPALWSDSSRGNA